jgi:hypothetical protein
MVRTLPAAELVVALRVRDWMLGMPTGLPKLSVVKVQVNWRPPSNRVEEFTKVSGIQVAPAML